jgi:hypothetical protein
MRGHGALAVRSVGGTRREEVGTIVNLSALTRGRIGREVGAPHPVRVGPAPLASYLPPAPARLPLHRVSRRLPLGF